MQTSLKLTIAKQVQNGLCLGYSEKPVFTRNAMPGEIVEAQLLQEKSQHAFAMARTIEKANPERIASDCAIYPDCGGCSFRHMPYSLELKTKIDLLNEYKYLRPALDRSLIHAASPDFYRARARLQVRMGRPGYFCFKSDQFIALPEEGCRQLPGDARQIEELAQKIGQGEMNLLFSEPDLAAKKTEATASKMEKRPVFSQANRFLKNAWLETIARYGQDASALDELFCGSAEPGLRIARASRKQLRYRGFDMDASALTAAQKAVKANPSNFDFFKADLYTHVPDNLAELVLANPPRAGLKKNLAHAINQSKTRRLIYSSCNPATLNRDISFLNNFSLIEIIIFDFFPRTAHLEAIAILDKK